jgi:hypothetical protein
LKEFKVEEYVLLYTAPDNLDFRFFRFTEQEISLPLDWNWRIYVISNYQVTNKAYGPLVVHRW